METLDKSFIKELKTAFLQSRYHAARVVNKELISLYFNIGKKISTKTNELAWGSKVLEQISKELQNELPGLKGFSAGNLKKMKGFAEFWFGYLSIGSTVSGEIQTTDKQISSSQSGEFIAAFLSVGFSHHYLIASKSKSTEEAQFYIYNLQNNEIDSIAVLTRCLRSFQSSYVN